MPDLQAEQEFVVTDPVCGMRLQLEKAAAQEEYEGWACFFCSDTCHRLFLAVPERYSSNRPAGASTRTG